MRRRLSIFVRTWFAFLYVLTLELALCAEEAESVLVDPQPWIVSVPSWQETYMIDSEHHDSLNLWEDIGGSSKGSGQINLTVHPSVSVDRQGFGGTQVVTLRGSPSQQVAIVVDGILINDPDLPNRMMDFAQAPLLSNGRVKVLAGAQSVGFGGNAGGGVIVFEQDMMDRGTAYRSQETMLEVGGGESLNLEGRMGATLGSNSTGRAAFQLQRWGGISAASEQMGNTEEDGGMRTSWNGQWSVRRGPWGLTSGLYLWAGSSDLDFQGGPGGDDPNYVATYNRGLITLSGSWNSASWKSLDNVEVRSLAQRWELRTGFLSNQRVYDNPMDSLHSEMGHYEYLGTRWQTHLHSLWRWPGFWKSRWGWTLQQEKMGSVESFDSSISSRFQGEFSSFAMFAEVGRNLPQIQWQVGLRQEQKEGGEKAPLVADLRFSVPIIGSVQWFSARWASGYNWPSQYQLFSVYGNPDLRPERSWSGEFFWNLQSPDGRLNWRVGVFTNRWHDLIDYNFNLSRNQNIARARTEGIEGVWSMVDHRGWNYRLSSQWMQSQDELALKELVGRPRWKISGKWSVPIDQKVSLWGEGQIRGPVWQMDPSSIDGQRSLREDYGVINLGYLYHWSSDIRIYARVNNVLNQTSDELLGYSSLGRSFYAGIHWRNPSGEAN